MLEMAKFKMRGWVDFIRVRWPHVDYKRNPWGRNDGDVIFRVFGFKPHCRFQIIDFTRAKFYTGKPHWSRLRVLSWTIFEINPELSGLPRR